MQLGDRAGWGGGGAVVDIPNSRPKVVKTYETPRSAICVELETHDAKRGPDVTPLENPPFAGLIKSFYRTSAFKTRNILQSLVSRRTNLILRK